MVGVLLIAGGLLTWGHSYIHNEVHAAAAVLLILSALGLYHARRTSPSDQILAGVDGREPVTAGG
jgi:hypothetical protein